MATDSPSPSRSGFCALLGLPNVGKSTLLNELLGVRLVAVSPKPQTTRNRILGVVNTETSGGDPAQIVFVDTPGIQRGKGALRRFMHEESMAAAGDSDLVLHVIDANDSRQRVPGAGNHPQAVVLRETLAATKAPAVLAINKVDKLRNKEELLPVIAAYAETGRYLEVIPISALRRDGIDRVVRAIADALPEGPALFPTDMVTDRAERFLVAELIREQLFRQLGEELPYATAVVVESFKERKEKNDVVIDATIYVERESQKGIVVGKGGRRIKEVGERARAAISELLGCPAHVKLFVKVNPDWSQGDRGIREMGYE